MQALKASYPHLVQRDNKPMGPCSFFCSSPFLYSYSGPGMGLLISINKQDNPLQTCSQANLISIIPQDFFPCVLDYVKLELKAITPYGYCNYTNQQAVERSLLLGQLYSR